MRLSVVSTARFRKEFRKAVKRGLEIPLFEEIVDMIAQGQPLPPKNKDHELSGKLHGYRECHIQNDWLLIYRIYSELKMIPSLMLSSERG